MDFFGVAYAYLKRTVGLEISKDFLKRRMLSHPDYPALLSLTDSLDELGVNYTASIIEKNDYEKLDYPILAHHKTNIENFMLIPSKESFKINKYFENWDGVYLYVKQEFRFHNQEHSECLKKEKNNSKVERLIFTFFFVFFITTTFFSKTYLIVVLQFLNIAGIIFSGSIALHQLGKGIGIVEKICSSEFNNSCDVVLNSKVGKWKGISPSDLGLVFYFGMGVYISSISLNTEIVNDSISLLLVPYVFAVMASLVSIYYQRFVFRHFCKMCLMVLIVIWLQAIVFFSSNYFRVSFSWNFKSYYYFGISLTTTAIIWMYVKSWFRKFNILQNTELEAIKFKRNASIFLSLLEKERFVHTVPVKYDIFHGNREALIQIMIVCNPYCKPCADRHMIVDQLLKVHKDKIGVTTRFVVKNSKSENKEVAAVKFIYAAYLSGNLEIVSEWYSSLDIRRQLYSQFISDELPILEIVKFLEEWTITSKINQTPTIFLNGFEFPKNYKTKDLELLVPDLVENIAL